MLSNNKFFKDINTIIWDWNGTLLNDTDICLEAINRMLSKRNIPILTHESYQELFMFPVREYYQNIGFDFTIEPFENLAIEFIELYNSKLSSSKLTPFASQILDFFASQNKSQIILSAMKQTALEKSISELDIYSYFDFIKGIDNDYADGKIGIGLWLRDYLELKPEKLCLIGDSIHDAEVANEIGCRCILVASGHQSFRRLEQTGSMVFNDLDSLLNFIKS
ncbi:MAG: HAD family hydrolase [Bacteroidales bacterium]|nr:HAD family hydrolase [Bacteroidales bacterium]